MRAIRLRNVRSLGDTGDVKLKPITLLLGQNSSGKSTLLRMFPLLMQSIRTRSNASVLWYGDLVDFGSVREVCSTFSPDQTVVIELDFGKVDLSRRGLVTDAQLSDASPNTRLALELVDADGRTRLSAFSIVLDKDRLRAEVDPRGIVTSLIANGVDLARYLPSDRYRFITTELVPQLISGRLPVSPRSSYWNSARRSIDGCERELKKFFVDRLPGRVVEQTIAAMVRRIQYRTGEHFVASLLEGGSQLKSAQALARGLVEESGQVELTRLRSLYMLWSLPDILIAIDRRVSRNFNNVSYVGPYRATGERYYRQQELAVDQIDPQGRNLAMFLHSLTSRQQQLFSEWLVEALGYSIQVTSSSGHIQIQLREESSSRFYNIADMGYGFSQILPIMAQVWSRQLRQSSGDDPTTIVAMEQPELHLHPAYQAKLADILARSISE